MYTVVTAVTFGSGICSVRVGHDAPAGPEQVGGVALQGRERHDHRDHAHHRGQQPRADDRRITHHDRPTTMVRNSAGKSTGGPPHRFPVCAVRVPRGSGAVTRRPHTLGVGNLTFYDIILGIPTLIAIWNDAPRRNVWTQLGSRYL